MRIVWVSIVLMLAACTPGAPSAGGGGGAATTTVNVSLTGATIVATPYGTSAGFTPAVTTVALGSTVRFVNVDSFAHTASSIGGAAFPAASPLGAAALSTFGDRLSTGWSSGVLAANSSSPPLLADVAGTYLYGCFFHYGAPTPMRAAIVVR